jgi:pantoate kinase
VPGASVRRGTAFAPSHVTGIFAPRLDARDPRGRGSVGAGLVLSAGVTASVGWRPASRSSVVVTADRRGAFDIARTVAERLGARRPGRIVVHLEHELPIGQGFGSSAAGALATGLAVARALGLPRKRAVEVAHLADLFGGGGLGGVAAILGGGLELRVKPGIPPFGRVLRVPVDGHVVVGTVGASLRTRALLASPALRARVDRAEGAFEELGTAPDWGQFWAASERFTDLARLAPPGLVAVVRGLRRRGARAAQAMFGRSFFASLPPGRAGASVVRWLARRSPTVRSISVAREGARALADSTSR